MKHLTPDELLKRDIRRLRAIADELDGIIALTGMPDVMRDIACNIEKRFHIEECAFVESRQMAEARNRIARETEGVVPSNKRTPAWTKDLVIDVDVLLAL